jgi:hypothetical protein
MNMKLNLCCACVIAVLGLCSVGVAEVLDNGYWDGGSTGAGSTSGWWTYSSPSAYASPSTNYSWAYGEGWYSMYTTVQATLTASVSAYVWAEAEVTANGDTGAYSYTTAYAKARIYSGRIISFTKTAYADYSDPDTSDGSTDGYSLSRSYPAGNGISCEHEAASVAYVTSGGSANAYTHGCARAYGTLY